MQTQPLQALIVEDHSHHAYIEETLLAHVGFQVQVARSIRDGLEQARALLAPAQGAPPALVLLDMMLPQSYFPELEGSTLAAYLGEQMEQGTLRRALLAAISGDLTEDRRHEAFLAGCSFVLPKPLRHEQACALRDATLALAQQSARPPSAGAEAALWADADEPDRAARQVLRRAARQVLRALQLMPEHPAQLELVRWDKERLRLLLVKPAYVVREEPWRSCIQQYGGLNAFRQRLLDLPLPGPSRALLVELLRGTNLKQLPMSRSTVYRRFDQLLDELEAMLNA